MKVFRKLNKGEKVDPDLRKSVFGTPVTSNKSSFNTQHTKKDYTMETRTMQSTTFLVKTERQHQYMKNFVLLVMCIIMFSINSMLTIFRFWERTDQKKKINLVLAFCFAFDILYFLKGQKMRLEIFDIVGYLLPNMILFLNPELRSFSRFDVELFNPQNQGKHIDLNAMNLDSGISLAGIVAVIAIFTLDMARTPLRYFKSKKYELTAEDILGFGSGKQASRSGMESHGSLDYLDATEE